MKCVKRRAYYLAISRKVFIDLRKTTLSLKVNTSGIYIKCWILFAEFSFGNEPYLEPQGKHLNMREKKLPSVSDDGTTFEEYLNGKIVRKKM